MSLPRARQERSAAEDELHNPLEPMASTLRAAVAEERDWMRGELAIPLVAGRTQPQDSAVGRPMSAALRRLLGHPNEMGTQFIIVRVEYDLWYVCRNEHALWRHHVWADGARRMFCWSLYHDAIWWEMAQPRLARAHGISLTDADSMLYGILRRAHDLRRGYLLRSGG